MTRTLLCHNVSLGSLQQVWRTDLVYPVNIQKQLNQLMFFKWCRRMGVIGYWCGVPQGSVFGAVLFTIWGFNPGKEYVAWFLGSLWYDWITRKLHFMKSLCWCLFGETDFYLLVVILNFNFEQVSKISIRKITVSISLVLGFGILHSYLQYNHWNQPFFLICFYLIGLFTAVLWKMLKTTIFTSF